MDTVTKVITHLVVANSLIKMKTIKIKIPQQNVFPSATVSFFNLRMKSRGLIIKHVRNQAKLQRQGDRRKAVRFCRLVNDEQIWNVGFRI